jgi:hypothetical protein
MFHRTFICPFSFGHCIVCPWFTTSYYPFGIFWSLCCLSLIYHFLLPLWYLLATVLYVLDLPLLITPLVSVGHCVVCPWFTTSYYPFGICWPLCCLSLIYHFLLPLWYLLAIVLSVLDLPLLITPLVSFGHCIIVCPWFTTSYYPFGICWPLCCLSLIYHFLLPLWYLLAIVLSVLDLPLLITPLVSVGHCIVCPWFTTSYYPFGIFWPLYCLSLIYHFLLPLWYLQTFLTTHYVIWSYLKEKKNDQCYMFSASVCL